MIAQCPHCDNEFYVPPDVVGQKVPCTKCRHDVRVVAPSDGDGAGGSNQTIIYNTLSDGVNLREGFKRLALVTSFLMGPVIWTVIKARDLYTLNASFSEPIDNSLRFIIIWGIGFTGCWAVYVVAVMLVRSFAIGRRRRERKKLARPLSVLAVASVLPLIPGLIGAWRYISSSPLWYWEDVFKHLLPWPAAGFAAVWGTYLITLFVGTGFRYKCSDQVLQDMRRFEPGVGAGRVAADSWRTR
ncbi:MAG TPA: hypothetical protein ENN87_11235 [Phycisphaerales bacterium]|nr:hypothetical protein [Phycisphaerales bacterium]